METFRQASCTFAGAVSVEPIGLLALPGDFAESRIHCKQAMACLSHILQKRLQIPQCQGSLYAKLTSAGDPYSSMVAFSVGVILTLTLSKGSITSL